MAKRPDYQNLGDNLDEITDKRNAVIRAWGKQVLVDADALLLHTEVADGNHWSDWEQLQDEDVEPNLDVVVEDTETEPKVTKEVPEVEPIVEEPATPKAAKPPKAPKPATS